MRLIMKDFCLFHSEPLIDGFNRYSGAFEAWPCIDPIALGAGNDVKMEMGDGLSGAFAAGIQQIDARISALFHAMTGYTLNSTRKMVQNIRWTVQNAFAMHFRYGDHVAIYIISNVHKHE